MPYTVGVKRRSFLTGALAWGGVLLFGSARTAAEQLAATSCLADPLGELVGVLPLHGPLARRTPFGEIVGGSGLDARKFTDLSRLAPGRLVTPIAELFLRTAAPPGLDQARARWPLPLDALMRGARPMGAHLIECAGNTDPDNFGLMSVAEWEGVPLEEFLADVPGASRAPAILVGGLDYEQSSRSSRAGASWIFSRDDLARTGAFLAVRLNGEVLPDDHGSPVRLVVPGWYGCSWIKWVNEIRAVGGDEPPTAQMLEFLLRTHQRTVPSRALDYEPPAIDLAAMPVRVEKRRIDGRLEYRVIGIVWGGERPVDRLRIRFRAGDEPLEFVLCPAPSTHRTWSLWEYRWRPPAPGLYSIALTPADPSIRARRLDVSFYVRQVWIDEV